MCIPDLRNLLQRRVRMYHDCVCGVAMCTKQFFLVWRPDDGGHLRRSLQRVQAGTSRAVPDVDGSVVGASAGSEEGRLPRTPRNCLNIELHD
jgi:hypothetical protein